MSCIKVTGGWRIKLEAAKGIKGRILPKLYKTKKACNKRIGELERHQ